MAVGEYEAAVRRFEAAGDLGRRHEPERSSSSAPAALSNWRADPSSFQREFNFP